MDHLAIISLVLLILTSLDVSAGLPAEDQQTAEISPVEELQASGNVDDIESVVIENEEVDNGDSPTDDVSQRFAALEEEIETLQQQIGYLSSLPMNTIYVSGDQGRKKRDACIPDPVQSGGLYVRWGRDDCPSTSVEVYDGIAGASHYRSSGGGSNLLCMPKTPDYRTTSSGVQELRGYVYSIDYETSDFSPLNRVHNNDVPCAVCQAKGRSQVLMIPARYQCPSGWMEEYDGYLMSERHTYYRSEYVCLENSGTESTPDSHGNSYNAELFPVEGRCSSNGGLPCGPYHDGYELTCVVCTK